MLKKFLSRTLLLSLTISLLTGCQVPAPRATPSKKPQASEPAVQVKTRASSYIYLTPMPKEQRTVYIATVNDSNTDTFELEPWLVQSLQEKSFRVVNNIDQANLVVRANLFRVGKLNSNEAIEILNSEFGNSTQLLTSETQPNVINKEVIVIDLQYFDRKDLVGPALTTPRSSMYNLSDVQLLLICNSAYWERFQARIIALAKNEKFSQREVFTAMGKAIATANSDIVRGIS